MTDLNAAFAAAKGTRPAPRFLELVADPEWEHRETFLAHAADPTISHAVFAKIAREYGPAARESIALWRIQHGFTG